MKRHRGEPLIETKFRSLYLGHDCVAKVDSMIICDKKKDYSLHIYDLKTGNFDYSESAWNQLYFAGLVWIAHTAEQAPAVMAGKTITIHPAICQPMYSQRPVAHMEPIIFDTPAAALFELEGIIQGIEAESKPVPGNQCTFCPQLLVCPAVQNIMQHVMYSPGPECSNREFLELVWLNKKIIEAYLLQTEELIKQKIQAGEHFPAVTVATGYGHRRWTDTGAVIDALGYLGDKLYKPKELLSPAQVEKIAGKKNIEGLYVTPEYPKLVKRESTFGAIK